MDKKAEISDELDALMLKVLKEGQVVVDAQGVAQVVTPTAAMIREIRGRLKDMGVTKELGKTGKANDIVREMRERGFKFGGKMPPISTDDDMSEAAG